MRFSPRTRCGTQAPSAFDPVVGLDAIASVLSADGHARSHHTTHVVVSEDPGDEVGVRSKGLGVMDGGTVISAVYEDEVRRTNDGRRISRRALHVK